MLKCWDCDCEYGDYRTLALHIITNQKTHHRGFRWANEYLLKDVIFGVKNPNEGRLPLTEKQKAAKESTERAISGRVRSVGTICPVCETPTSQTLPVEYTDDPFAWRIRGGLLVVSCQNCRR
jgi:hypothetical protein